jgi:hypothetical protein
VDSDGLAQRGDRAGIRPRHTGRSQLAAALGRPFAGADDRRNHLIGGRFKRCGVCCGSNLNGVVLEGDAVGVLALVQHQADRVRGHRYPEDDVHDPSKNPA